MFDYVRTDLMLSPTLPPGVAGATQMLSMIKELGTKTLVTDYGPPDKRPERRIDKRGNIISSIGIEHPCLDRGYYHDKHLKVARHKNGTGGITYLEAERCIGIRQHAFPEDGSANNQLAFGQLRYIQLIHAKIQAVYGWIDTCYGPKRATALSDGRPRFLFWGNFFGRAIVKAIGIDFLTAAPGEVIALDDGSLIYVVSKDIHEWSERPGSEAVNFLRKRLPGLRVYRRNSSALPDELDRIVQIDDSTGEETTVYKRKRSPKK